MNNLTKAALLSLAFVAMACGEKTPNPGNTDEPIEPFSPTTVKVCKTKNLQAEGASADGKYVCGTNLDTGCASIWDTDNETSTDIPDFYATLHAVNKKGQAVGFADADAVLCQLGGASVVLYRSDEQTSNEFEGETYYTPLEAMAEAYGISEDGETVVGFVVDGNYQPVPCVWKKPFNTADSRTILPVPTDEEAGFAVSGAAAKWISADGKRIFGYVRDDFSTDPLIVWDLQKDGSWKANFVSKAYNHPTGEGNPQYMMFMPQGASADGNWVSLTVSKPYDFENWESPVEQVARLNLESGVVELLDSDNFVGYGISNDGTMIGATGGFMVFTRDSYVWPAGEKTAVNIKEVIAGIADLGLSDLVLGAIGPMNNFAMGFANDDEYNVISFIVK